MKTTSTALVALCLLNWASCSKTECPREEQDAAVGEESFAEIPLLVETEYGPVRGVIGDSSRIFRGIAYAAPPVGALRFAAPQPPKKWSEPPEPVPTLCPQFSEEVVTGIIGDEACLTLDVWTPIKAPDGLLPVMVWIHGGGYTAGSGYLAEAFLPTRDVIVVAVNYRLGVLGFLAHPALTEEGGGTSGNYGIEDQRFALEWVRDNIEAFGGDPDNVTIFGESAGGAAVASQLWSSRSAGLFHRAIMQSGNLFGRGVKTLEDAEAQGERLAAALACDTEPDVVDCLRSLSFDQLLNAPIVASYRPCFDGVVFEKEFLTAIKNREINLVPTMVGSNSLEGLGFVLDLVDMTEEQYIDRIETTYPENADELLSLYPVSKYITPQYAYSAMMSHGSFNCSCRRAARALTEAGADVYLYYYSWGWAFHAAELALLFGVGAFPEEQVVSSALKDYWTQFAKTGNPNGGELPQWPRFETESESYMNIGFSIEAGSGFLRDECDFWDEL
ncbi:MAG: carboxylesterase family protein [Deltaproteobacteria bacterium]|nr:carboxylesterase family protein [Deltaproteobacteria bacterium]